MKNYSSIELHGHRGARGLWPENSLYGFLKAIDSRRGCIGNGYRDDRRWASPCVT